MIVAGFGFRQGAETDSLRAALAATGVAPEALATVADKAPSLAYLAAELGLPLIVISPATLAKIDTPTQSAASQAARDTGSVAEACALAALGTPAQITQTRVIGPDHMATCAIAEGAPR